MLIRRAAPEDYETVGTITEAAYEEFLEGPDDYYRSFLRDAARRDREAELWVAVDDDGSLLGSVTSCPPGSPWRELSSSGMVCRPIPWIPSPASSAAKSFIPARPWRNLEARLPAQRWPLS